MPFQPRIAISGAGPAGLALSLLLEQRGLRPTLFELRSKPTSTELAKPSGMLDLHEESGLRVMRECGLWTDFKAATGECSEEARTLNAQGKLLHQDHGDGKRPEISRNALTNLLLRNIAPDTIRWNTKVIGAHSAPNTTTGATEITLDLGHNGTSKFDFVVGADGAWSRIRRLLTGTLPLYSGAQLMPVTIRSASTKYPHLSALSGSGSMTALGNRNGIMSQRGPQDSIRVHAVVSTPLEEWARETGLEGKTAAEIKKTLLGENKYFGSWAPELKELLGTACDEETRDNPGGTPDIYPLYMLPVGHCWEYRPGVTLVGDAAHLMTPWAGEGVNLALWDVLELAEVLGGVPAVADAAEWQAALEPRIRGFEDVMLTRAKKKAEVTAHNMRMFLAEDGAEAVAAFFRAAYEGGEGQ